MASEEGFFPVPNLRDPFVQHQQGRDAPEEQNADAEGGQAPGCNPQFRYVEVLEWKPGADVDETSAVENEVNEGGEELALGAFDFVEVAVP
jgi:hypothetical protein